MIQKQRYLFIDRDGTLIEEPLDEQIDSFAKLKFVPTVFKNLGFIKRHLDFKLQFEAGAETPFKTDLRSVVRIVELLLDNAIKFTHPAEAYMQQLRFDKKEKASLTVSLVDGQARFVVEDSGMGIPKKEAERIFDEFVQLDEYYDGTGIGLAVARSLARRLGGDVVLDTDYTAGARFVLYINVNG